ncbi:MAG: shikimate dehydrogenase [Hyphomicrobiaceae bacterium]
MPRACVIGWPISHSRSPLIHGYWLKELGIEGRYEKTAVAPHDLAAFLGKIGFDGLQGCNVTVPHKVAVLDMVDRVSEVARSVGAANTIWIEDGLLHATNTDMSGFMTHLKASAPGWSADAGPAVIVGAGGAARAIVYGLREAGVPEIRVVNRTMARAEQLAVDFGPTVRPCPMDQVTRTLADASVLVNTSSLGMTGNPPLDLDLGSLPDSAVVADIVYSPLETRLLAQARTKGCVLVDGLGMLLHQAVRGFELWFGKRPTVGPELRSLIIADLEAA